MWTHAYGLEQLSTEACIILVIRIRREGPCVCSNSAVCIACKFNERKRKHGHSTTALPLFLSLIAVPLSFTLSRTLHVAYQFEASAS